MNCIYCGGDTKVVNSRHQKRTNRIWRRRACLLCQAVFTTDEQVVMRQSLMVRMPGGSLEPFSRDKLLLSVYDTLKHRKTALTDATALMDTIWSRLLPKISEASLDRETIVDTVISILKRFDRAASVSYRAYHPKSSASKRQVVSK